MRELLPGVFTWSWFSERHGYDFNGYLVRAPGGNVCVDPVEMSDETLDAIAREGVSVIALTNRNHTRASARVREKTGAPVVLHAADAAHARAQGVAVDRELAFGDRVGPFVALDAHGKSPGEVALHWPERRMLVVGDACAGSPGRGSSSGCWRRRARGRSRRWSPRSRCTPCGWRCCSWCRDCS